MEDAPQPTTQEVLDVGMLLGQNQAFGLVAGRCTAAQAQLLRRMREEKLYLHLCPRWRDFCDTYLHLPGSSADNIIRLLDEFGPDYFDLAQLTRISADTYRALAPSIENGVLHIDGDQIALTRENSRKVADAVAQIRRNLPAPNSGSVSQAERLKRIDQLCTILAEEFESMPGNSQQQYMALSGIVARLSRSLENLRAYFDV